MSAVQCPVLPDQRTRRTSEYVALREKYVALPVKKIIVFGPRMICPLNIQHPSKRAFKFFSTTHAKTLYVARPAKDVLRGSAATCITFAR